MILKSLKNFKDSIEKSGELQLDFLLCQMLGNLVESGQYPASELDTLGKIVEDICYNNAKEFFEF